MIVRVCPYFGTTVGCWFEFDNMVVINTETYILGKSVGAEVQLCLLDEINVQMRHWNGNSPRYSKSSSTI